MNNFNSTVDYTGADVVKKKSKGAIIGIGALVVVGASVLSYAFIPQVKNAVRMATQEPSQYVQTVAKDNANKFASAIAKQYVSQLDTYTKTAYDYNVNVQISDDFITDMVGLSYLSLPDTLVKDYTITGNVDLQENVSAVSATLLANQDTVATLNAISDFDGKRVYLQVPELSDSYVYTSIEDDTNNSLNDYLEKLEEVSSDLAENDISVSDVEDTIVKYSNIIIDNLTGESTLDKNVEGAVLNVEYKYNVVSTKVTEDNFISMANQLLDELENDETAKKILFSNGSITEEDFEKAISSARDEIPNVSSSDDYATVYTYINSMGIICGFELVGDDESMGIMYAKDNLDYVLQFYVYEADNYNSIDCTATQTSNNTFDGTITINENGSSLDIDFNDFTYTNDSYSGSFNMDLTSLGTDFQKLSVDVSSGKDSQSLSLALDNQLTISATATATDNKDITIPTENVFDYDTQSAEYLDTIVDEEEFLMDILKKVGLYDWYQDMVSDWYGYYTDYTSSDDTDYVYNDLDDLETIDYSDEDNSYYYDDDSDNDSAYFNFNDLDMSYNSEKFTLLGEPTKSMLTLDSGSDDEDYYGNNATYYTDNESIYIVSSDDGIESIQVIDVDAGIPDFKINGVGIGSTYEDINKAFGTTSDSSSSNITIYDIYSDYIIEFYLSDGTVYGIFIW